MPLPRQIFIVALLGLLACQPTTPDSPPANGELFETPALSSVPLLDAPNLREASGLTASRANQSLLWALNDSGDGARVFLIGPDGKQRAEYQLEGATNRDWEDMASTEISGVKTVFVGDIGNNINQNSTQSIYSFAEPTFSGATSGKISSVARIEFKYPDGSHNSEALLVDHQTKDLYIVTKQQTGARLYRLPYPQSTNGVVTAEALGELPVNNLTAGDISPDNQEVILRNYEEVLYWKRGSGEALAATLRRAPVRLPYLREPQGEGLAFAADGSGYFTISEVAEGIQARLFFYKRK
ncbi:MAG: PE-PGRS family protein [Cytophagaceae bacterium]|nr:PE-PGRS family protein [Cytophagaceae bacterium]